MAMSKYAPIKAFLSGQVANEVPMTFGEIEKLIGQSLPPAAFKHRPWWSNSPTNNVMTKAWLEAGYKSERVDMAARRLTFVRAATQKPLATPPRSSSGGVLARVLERLGGSVTIPEGVDITAPTGEVWDARR
jgi:hypothetical protein